MYMYTHELCQHFGASTPLICRASHRNTPDLFDQNVPLHCSMPAFPTDFRRLPASPFDKKTLHPNACL